MGSHTLAKLVQTLSDFTPTLVKEKISLLNQINDEHLTLKEFKDYHDKLLFLAAYPQDLEILQKAESELLRLTEFVHEKSNLKTKLINSGVAFSTTQSTYTFALTKWLVKSCPGTVSFHSFEVGAQHPKLILKHLLPAEEFEILFDDKLKPVQWLEKASGTKDKSKQIIFLVELFEISNLNAALKEHLFESLKIYIEINPSDKFFSRTFGKVTTSKLFFHSDPLLKKFAERELIERALPKQVKLSATEKKQIISCSRIALCLLQRETDPVTFSEENNIQFYELERGLSIALFSIDKDQRLPLESYIGFMMFKNGYPMSYGGAWLFGERALIGINIFEAFRGGESALVFAQLLRCYHKAFGVTYFEVEPYQFGKNNPEGIKSGAFWFYYRFGFRPVQDDLKELADTEHQRIVSQKGYRTSFETLKKFTRSNLGLSLQNNQTPLNPSDLSRFITEVINRDYNSDRKKALKERDHILRKEQLFSKESSKGAEMLGMFIAFCLDLSKLSATQKEHLKRLMTAKASDEFEYIRLLHRFQFEKHLNKQAKAFLFTAGDAGR